MKSYRLIDIVDLIGGGTPKTNNSDYWGGNIPWISVKDLGCKGRYVKHTEKSITEAGLENSSTRMLQEDDIVLSARGTVGEMAMLSGPMAFNQSCFGIRGKKEILDQTYLYYLLKNNLRRLKNHSYGSVFDTITRNTFADIEVTIPDISQQKKVAGVLSRLDDKISLNENINDYLMQAASALYKAHFEEFTFPISSHDMIKSELGLIPKEAMVQTIGDIAEIIDCLHSKKPERSSSGKPLLQLNNIGDNGDLDLYKEFLISDSDYAKWIGRCEATAGDCVITNVGRVGAVAQIPLDYKAALGRNMTCIRCKGIFPYPSFMLLTLISNRTRREIDKNTDCGTILSALNVKNIPKIRIVCFDPEKMELFEKMTRPLLWHVECTLAENIKLSAIRDSIIPGLLNGRTIIHAVK